MDRLSVREVRALKLLAERGPMGLSQLKSELGIPPSSIHGMLTKLMALGLVAKDEAKQYKITVKGREALDQVRKMLLVVG